MTSFLQMAILSISRPRTEIKMTLESWSQTDPRTHIFIFENSNSEIWPYMTRPMTWSFSVVDFYGVNGLDFFLFYA